MACLGWAGWDAQVVVDSLDWAGRPALPAEVGRLGCAGCCGWLVGVRFRCTEVTQMAEAEAMRVEAVHVHS